MKKLLQVVKNTILSLAEAMENVRRNVLIFCYQLTHIRTGQKRYRDYLSEAKPELNRYQALAKQIKDTTKERKSLFDEKKSLSIWNIHKAKKLSTRIAELTELLESHRSEKTMALQCLNSTDEDGLSAVKKTIAVAETELKKLKEYEAKYVAEPDNALKQYVELQTQAAEFEPLELYEARRALRPGKEQSAVQRVQSTYGEKYSYITMSDSKREASKLLNEYSEDRAMQALKRKQHRKAEQEHRQNLPPRKKHRDDWER